MYRKLIEELMAWKNDSYGKPMIIRGARQGGKNWLMKEFGRIYHEKYIYIFMDTI